MKKLIKKVLWYYTLLLNRLKLLPSERVFIIGHMRCGSSLLAHILFSNSEIVGIGETATKYTGSLDHQKLSYNILMALRFPIINGVYLLDKILHKKHVEDPQVLFEKKSKIILMLRKPSEALPSIINLANEDNYNWKQYDALRYYCERLDYLQEIASKAQNENGYFFLIYDDLLNNKTEVLAQLTRYLGIKDPLNENYKTLRVTGKKGFGDWTNNIISGKILSNKISSGNRVKVDKQTLEKAEIKYLETIKFFQKTKVLAK